MIGRVRKHFTGDGRRLSYLDLNPAGARRTLVLLHAFPLSADMWAPQFASPPADWRVVAPDFRGFGESEADGVTSPTAGLTVDDYARDVLGLLEHLHVGPIVVGGLSLGGYVAFALLRLLGTAAASADAGGVSLLGLVLADTRPQADTDEGRIGRLRMAEMVDRDGAAGVARAIVPKLVDEATFRRRPQAVDAVRRMILAAPPDAIKGALYRMMSRPDSAGALAQIGIPTLVIVGDRDTLTPPDVSREMHARIPGSTLEIVPESGHVSNLEQPELFAATLNRFLDRL
jgi:pimeloyl-ACP methyl ester carboxylesterase